jgi:hypothetical protein
VLSPSHSRPHFASEAIVDSSSPPPTPRNGAKAGAVASTSRDEPAPAIDPSWRGVVIVHRNEVVVEVQSAASLDVVDQALIAALLEAGVAAEKEGPRVAHAVVPAMCFGKVRVSPRDEEHLRKHLERAREAAVRVLRGAHCVLE